VYNIYMLKNKLFTVVGVLLFVFFGLFVTSASAQSYVPSYESYAPSLGEYGYQWSQAEGIIPPSYPETNAIYGMNAASYYPDTSYYAGVPYSAVGIYNIADASYDLSQAHIVNCTNTDSRWRQDEVGYYTPSYNTQVASAGNARYALNSRTQPNTTNLSNAVAPTCKLTPKSTGTNTVILEWVTNGATTAFIDNGIGHVSLTTGARMVTPLQSTVYTMVVVNEFGASTQCAANIVVKGTAPVGSQTLTVGTPAQTNGAVAVPTPAAAEVDENGDPVSAATAKASAVSGNIGDKIVSAVGTGQSIWERIRSMSLIALGIFIVLAVVVGVMKKMFGGGGEGAH
jgi:hypothetical protein